MWPSQQEPVFVRATGERRRIEYVVFVDTWKWMKMVQGLEMGQVFFFSRYIMKVIDIRKSIEFENIQSRPKSSENSAL